MKGEEEEEAAKKLPLSLATVKGTFTQQLACFCTHKTRLGGGLKAWLLRSELMLGIGGGSEFFFFFFFLRLT